MINEQITRNNSSLVGVQFAAKFTEVELKRCPRCEENLPLSEFGVCRARKDGLNLYCRRCIRQKINLQRQAFREYKKLQLKRVASLPQPPKPVRTYSKDIKQRLSRHDRRFLRSGPIEDRVMTAIERGFYTQREIASATRLLKDEVGDAITNLLLWTKQIRTKVIRGQRMYFINESDSSKQSVGTASGSDRINQGFSSIGALMPRQPASRRVG